MKLFTALLAILMAVTFTFTSCKKDEDSPVQPPSSTPTTYVGTIAGATESGAISLVVGTATNSDAMPINITGILRLVGATDTVFLTGTLSGDTLLVTGGGYTFTGILSGNQFTGTYNGPGGSGSFVANASTSTAATRVFCGTYTETPPGTETGTFNMVINANNTISVIAVDASDGAQTPFEGTLTGSTISIYVPGTPGAVIATGTLTGTSVSGTYNSGSTDGTWTGEQF